MSSPKPSPRAQIYNSIIETIGATPLVRVSKLAKHYDLSAELLVKLEFCNPLASIKDRVALAMIEAAEKAEEIIPGEHVLVEATSGNAAISLASVAAAKGYDLILVMPESIPLARRQLLTFYGAKLELTPPDQGMKGALDATQKILRTNPRAYALE